MARYHKGPKRPPVCTTASLLSCAAICGLVLFAWFSTDTSASAWDSPDVSSGTVLLLFNTEQ